MPLLQEMACSSNNSVHAVKLQDFCRKTGAAGIATMASGGVAPTFRFYMYAKPTGGSAMVLTEAVVDKTMGSASVTLKCADAAPVQPFAELFRRQLDAMAG